MKPIAQSVSVRVIPLATCSALLATALLSSHGLIRPSVVEAQTPASAQPMTLKADVQEANSKTGVVTARGNVRINYPARQIQATAAQAQYFSKERRIILTGNVYILQQGNSMRGETVTYLIDEGRFVALPQPSKQVETIYLVQETTAQTPAAAAPKPAPSPPPSPFESQPQFTPPSGTPTQP